MEELCDLGFAPTQERGAAAVVTVSIRREVFNPAFPPLNPYVLERILSSGFKSNSPDKPAFENRFEFKTCKS